MKIAMFQGPDSGHLLGWRHYLIKMWPVALEPVTRVTLSSEFGAERMAAHLKARLYPHGSWENGPYIDGMFPRIRPEIEGEILGTKQVPLHL